MWLCCQGRGRGQEKKTLSLESSSFLFKKRSSTKKNTTVRFIFLIPFSSKTWHLKFTLYIYLSPLTASLKVEGMQNGTWCIKELVYYAQPQFQGGTLETLTTRRTSLPPVFLSVKRGVPPSTFPPSGTKRASITPFAGDGTCTEVFKRKTDGERVQIFTQH